MGLAGQYIDSRDDEAKDRIIEGQLWGDGFCDNGHRCLCGHAEDWLEEGFSRNTSDRPERNYSWRSWRSSDDVFNIAPRLFRRFGQDRIVALFKARAAKNNSFQIPKSKGTNSHELGNRTNSSCDSREF